MLSEGAPKRLEVRAMIETFSKKQLRALSWWHEKSPDYTRDAIICDGAVRSGKTFCMSLSFVLWSFYAFNGGDFGLCGKTIRSLRRNMVTPIIPPLLSVWRKGRGLGGADSGRYAFGGNV